jgi:ankyrin repeat protein
MNHDAGLNSSFVNHCSKGDLRLVALYAKNAGADVNARDTTGLTALMAACERGHIKVVLYLLEKGADVNAKQDSFDRKGVTAIMIASAVGNENVVKILLENGADVYCKTESGVTALMKAMENGHVNIMTLIKNHINRNILLVIEKGRAKDETPLLRHSQKDIAKHIASFLCVDVHPKNNIYLPRVSDVERFQKRTLNYYYTSSDDTSSDEEEEDEEEEEEV